MHFANSVCPILHAPGFNWCCQKATKAMHLMSLGKEATGYGFCQIWSLFWHDSKMGVVAICLEPTGWNRQACPPSEAQVVTTFHGSKMTVSKTWVQKYTNWTVRNLYFCICIVIGFLQGWTEMLYFCYSHSKCMSLCVNMCTHCIYHSSNQTLPCQHVVYFYIFLLQVRLLLVQYSSPLNFILNMNIFYLLTESHSLLFHPVEFQSTTRRSSDTAVFWCG